jgi:AmiR/NasT family two-component response regulator
MKGSLQNVLVLGQQFDDLHPLASVLQAIRCSVAIANSEDQAIAHANQTQPCLIILAGNHYAWSPASVDKLRGVADRWGMTLVALTDFHAPSWITQEENPGFDGFLVKPVSGDVLTSLVQSAWVRQTCLAS